ncbi:hypothetical protein PSTG_03156 [Puccinia striiformis f. sp. tritici PST-78]|uniref:Uncharacterized protein n=1 Tax=Puccinia striiformis f. sp. tritici PST-78 TaxID=1165861 RepID=A0A0L0VX99_9BASI|nr:hypothetical protein PSTG_03156 [Puccinia striiformis f. sp. tritici PST-78]
MANPRLAPPKVGGGWAKATLGQAQARVPPAKTGGADLPTCLLPPLVANSSLSIHAGWGQNNIIAIYNTKIKNTTNENNKMKIIHNNDDKKGEQ